MWPGKGQRFLNLIGRVNAGRAWLRPQLCPWHYTKDLRRRGRLGEAGSIEHLF
jgi:hypothetical protein